MLVLCAIGSQISSIGASRDWLTPQRRARTAYHANPARKRGRLRNAATGATRVRLTWAEQQRRTHEHLLDAGRQVFLRHGFLAATVEEIAADAGYTRGAVYKHFGGKEGLWLAIVEADADGHLRGLREALSRATSRDEMIAALNPADVADKDAAKWSAAAAEVLAATARQPETAVRIAAIQRRHDDEVVALLAEHSRRLRLEPAIPLDQAVVMIGALGIGLAPRQTVAPAADPAAVLTHVLGTVFPPEAK